MKKLCKQDLTDILYGCAIYGTGGGGRLEEGFEYIEKAFAAGKDFNLVDIDDVPSGSYVCTPYMLGTVTQMPTDAELKYKRLPRNSKSSIMTAFRRLEAYSGHSFYGTICCELGGSNTAISFYVAAMIDGFIIDGDPAGRAVPEITHSTYYLNELPAAPIVSANEFGECFICENIVDDQRAEDLIRALAITSRNDIAAIDHAMDIDDVRDVLIKGTISSALALGSAFRKAKKSKQDIANAIARHGNGEIAFRGEVSHFECKNEGGFTCGEVEINGTGKFTDHKLKILIKNENMAAWLNGELHITIPDLICLIDMEDLKPVVNPEHRIGMNVAVVVLPAAKEFTSKKGLAAFGPAYLGLDDEYQPFIST